MRLSVQYLSVQEGMMTRAKNDTEAPLISKYPGEILSRELVSIDPRRIPVVVNQRIGHVQVQEGK